MTNRSSSSKESWSSHANHRIAISNPSKLHTPSYWHWLKRSKSAALVWTAMRIWLGVMWLQAGIAKIWGNENSSFLHHNVPAWQASLRTASPPTAGGELPAQFVVPNAAGSAYSLRSLNSPLVSVWPLVPYATAALEVWHCYSPT